MSSSTVYADMRRMKRSRLWRHGLVILLSCGVGVFGRTDNIGGPTTVSDSHANIDCAVCHSLVASLDEAATAPSPTERCQSCHGKSYGRQSGLAAAFHQNPNRPCGDCHLYHEPGMISAAGNVFSPTQSAGPDVCSACHDGTGRMDMLSEGHRLAAGLYHSNYPAIAGLTSSESCLLCHGEEQSLSVEGIVQANVPRFNSHRMHPVGPIGRYAEFRSGVRVRGKLDPRLQLFGNRMECQTCHQLTAFTKNCLVDFGSPEALCLACHEFK